MDWKPLVTLLAIVNPPAIIPFFIHYTQGFSRGERRRTIWVASFSAFCVIAASALLGIRILEFFSISCLLYTSPSPRDGLLSRMPSSA